MSIKGLDGVFVWFGFWFYGYNDCFDRAIKVGSFCFGGCFFKMVVWDSC